MSDAPIATTEAASPTLQPTEVGPAPSLGAGFLGFLLGAAALLLALRRARRNAAGENQEG